MELEINIGKEKEKEDYSADMGKIKNVEISKAENGWVVSYRTMESMAGKSKMDHCEYCSKKMVYTKDKSDDAFTSFRSLKEKEESDNWY
jgi:hypothetical protein